MENLKILNKKEETQNVTVEILPSQDRKAIIVLAKSTEEIPFIMLMDTIEATFKQVRASLALQGKIQPAPKDHA